MKYPTQGDRLNRESLQAALGAEAQGLSLYVFDQLDSTNNEAKRIAEGQPDADALIVAEQQTAGRGRLGRSFYSPLGTGVYFSLLHRVSEPLENAVSVTSAAAVAVMRAIRRICGKQTEIKWVNDLYLHERKVCGILTEAVCFGGSTFVIVGIGINLSTVEFPNELCLKAGSLDAHDVSRAALIAAIWQDLKLFLYDPADRTWLEDYRAYSCVIGRPIVWTRGEESRSGVALAIDENGALEVLLPNGEHELLRTGEISVRVSDA